MFLRLQKNQPNSLGIGVIADLMNQEAHILLTLIFLERQNSGVHMFMSVD